LQHDYSLQKHTIDEEFLRQFVATNAPDIEVVSHRVPGKLDPAMKFFQPFAALLKGWFASFLAWGFVAALMTVHSLMLDRGDIERNLNASIRDWLPWAILTPLLFRLVARFPIDRRAWRSNAALHVFCAIVFVGAVHWWKGFFDPTLRGAGNPPPPPFNEAGDFRRREMPPPPPPPSDLLLALSFEFPIYLMIVSAAHTLYFYRRGELRKGQLATAHLAALQSRLQPHFLFNTLNTIAGLVHKAPDKADTVLTMLSDLLRFSFENTAEVQIPLKRELEFVQKYLAIMQVRYEHRVRFDFQIAPETLAACVPTLVLQPLVENAIKYGVEPNPDGGAITIHANRTDDRLLLSVSNSGSGLRQFENFTEGIGISNTRTRLRELFGSAASLTFHNGRAVTAEIIIPFRAGT
jgi:two-component system, LytTR family, sensor kinase